MGRANALRPDRLRDSHPPLARAELPIDTVSLARYLIGKVLVRELPEGVASGRIVETEAYVMGDAAGHAYRGMTRRNRSLFLERGHAYIYLAYGTSYMLNCLERDAWDRSRCPHQGGRTPRRRPNHAAKSRHRSFARLGERTRKARRGAEG